MAATPTPKRPRRAAADDERPPPPILSTETPEEDGDEEMEEQSATAPSKSATSHAQTRAVQAERKRKRRDGELLERAKRLWEDVRRADTASARREELLGELWGLVSGKVMDLIFKHDASRIVQTMLKLGDTVVRQQIAAEMTGHYVRLAKSPYARNTVLKVLLYCPNLRKTVIREFFGQVIPMLRHKDAALVIEEIFLEYAKAPERQSLLEEFYGPEFALFKTTEASEPRPLAEIATTHPEKIPGILKNLHEVIRDMINKGTVRFNIVHYAISDFLAHAAPQQIQDFVEDIREHLPEILHTQRGCRVAMTILAYGNAKDRKVIIKSFKDLVVKIAKEEHGHLVLLRLFDVVDDTVLVNKAILSEIDKGLGELVRHKYGRKCILYLLAGRSRSYFDPATLDLLSLGDATRATSSKKDPSERSKELLKYVSPALVKLVASEALELVQEQFGAHIVLETLINAEGRQQAHEAVINVLVASLDSGEGNLFEHIIANRVIKRLINIEAATGVNDGFSTQLYGKLQGHLAPLASTWASVVVLALLEHPAIQSQVLTELSPVANKGKLGDSTIIGTLLLIKKVFELRHEAVPATVAQRLKSTERPGQKREAPEPAIIDSPVTPHKKVKRTAGAEDAVTKTPSTKQSPRTNQVDETEKTPKAATASAMTPARTPRHVVTRHTPPMTRSARKR